MSVRSAKVDWSGSLKEGKGSITVDSHILKETNLSFKTRFGDDEESGTNPEELLAAAEAGCYSMALTSGLEKAGYTPEYVNTTAKIHLTQNDDGLLISRMDVITNAKVPDISNEEFQKFAEDTKKNCIISRALASIPEITIDATLDA